MNDPVTTVDTKNTLYPTALGRCHDGFMVQLMLHSLETGLRTPADFIKHFPPATIMASLADRAMLRAKILVEAAGTKEKIALRMDAAASGAQLQIALDEGETKVEDIVRLFEPDERVRYLPRPKLWLYEIESECWKTGQKDKDAFARAKAHVALILQAAIDNLLLTHKELVDALTLTELGNRLPKEDLVKLIAQALASTEKFNEEHVLTAVPPETLVTHVPLPTLWEKVVVPLIAERHGFVEKAEEEDPSPKA